MNARMPVSRWLWFGPVLVAYALIWEFRTKHRLWK